MEKKNNQREKSYAVSKNRFIKRLLSTDKNTQYAFSSEEKAINQIAIFKKLYITTSIVNDVEIPETELRIWIRFLKHSFPGVARKAVSKGEYVHVTIYLDKEDDLFRYKVEILNIDPTLHPQRGNNINRNPNRGHPIFRGLFKGEKRIYSSEKKILQEFEKANEIWPKTVFTLPGNKLTAQFYVNKNGKRMFPKYVFEPVRLPDGRYYVKHYLNDFERNLSVGYKPFTININV